MAKRLTREQKKEQAVIDIINKMFEIAGHAVTYDDIKDRKDIWFQEYTMTMAQNEEWKEWGTKLLAKKRRYGKKLADREMRMLDLYCGLKVSDPNF